MQGYIHIHGIFTIADQIGFYRNFLPGCRAFGNVKFDTCKGDQLKGWIEYISKDILMMMETLDRYLPVPLTHCNIGTYKRFFLARYKLSACRREFNSKPVTMLARVLRTTQPTRAKRIEPLPTEDDFKPEEKIPLVLTTHEEEDFNIEV